MFFSEIAESLEAGLMFYFYIRLITLRDMDLIEYSLQLTD